MPRHSRGVNRIRKLFTSKRLLRLLATRSSNHVTLSSLPLFHCQTNVEREKEENKARQVRKATYVTVNTKVRVSNRRKHRVWGQKQIEVSENSFVSIL